MSSEPQPVHEIIKEVKTQLLCSRNGYRSFAESVLAVSTGTPDPERDILLQHHLEEDIPLLKHYFGLEKTPLCYQILSRMIGSLDNRKAARATPAIWNAYLCSRLESFGEHPVDHVTNQQDRELYLCIAVVKTEHAYRWLFTKEAEHLDHRIDEHTRTLFDIYQEMLWEDAKFVKGTRRAKKTLSDIVCTENFSGFPATSFAYPPRNP